MFYSTINDDYYGIKVIFNEAPIKNYPLKEFVFSGHDLLVMLNQSWQKLYELIQPELHFTTSLPFPLKAKSPSEWLDFAQLLRQGKNEQHPPKLILDVGGRKIMTYVPSDRYCYDYGKLPLYTVRT